MPDGNRPESPDGSAPFGFDYRFGSLDPARKRRVSGSVYESPVLGRLEFVRMPPGRSSFWFGHQSMPDRGLPLQIVCEVADDDVPGVDHVASVITLRRNQVRDAVACLPLLKERMAQLGLSAAVREDDLILTAIYLRAKPLMDPCHELEYHVALEPSLLVTVAFVYGVPLSLRVDLDA